MISLLIGPSKYSEISFKTSKISLEILEIYLKNSTLTLIIISIEIRKLTDNRVKTIEIKEITMNKTFSLMTS
jgi:hypothetical protein